MLFYPSHDIALANGLRHFNPPAMARHLQEDLAYLAHIWNRPYRLGETATPIPWGWDYDTRQYIQKEYRIKPSLLPTDEDLALLRHLSSRQTTITINERLAQALPELQVSIPRLLTTEEALTQYITRHDQEGKRFVLKTPWSSSGRGLTVSHTTDHEGQLRPTRRDTMTAHALSTLRRMGGIMAEEWVTDKAQDFAMLFQALGHRVGFIGYSLFDNDESLGGVTYRQGYLLGNEQIVERLGVDHSLLNKVASHLEQVLTDLLRPLLGKPWPVGYLGVDMMTTRHGTVVPCVELNLRTTMGVVCRLWHDEHQQDGVFRISEMQDDGHFHAEFLTAK